MKRNALIVVSLGLVLLIVMSSLYVLMPGESRLGTERGKVFTGLDPWALFLLRSPPAKVGDAAYLLTVDTVGAGEDITFNRTIIRLDLGSGAVQNHTLEPLGDLDNDTYVWGLLEGDGELYAYGWRPDPVSNATEIVLWEIDMSIMQLGEAWVVPGIVNTTMCDMLIEDGLLYKMPGYAYEMDDDGVSTSMVTSPSIMIWDITRRELVDTINVTEALCDSKLLPFGDGFFGYWTGMRYLSDSFVYDPGTGLSSPVSSLDGYDNYRICWSWGAAVVGDAIITLYLNEYVNLHWVLSDTVLALDRSYRVTEGELLMTESSEPDLLIGCADDGGTVVLYCQVLGSNTAWSTNVTAYHLDYTGGQEAFHPLLFAAPLMLIGIGVAIQFRKVRE